MRLQQSIKPISYVKAHAAEVIRDVAETGNPMVITQNGEAKAVLMDVREYDAMQESLALLKILSMGMNEVRRGESLDSDAVFDELASDLKALHDARE